MQGPTSSTRRRRTSRRNAFLALPIAVGILLLVSSVALSAGGTTGRVSVSSAGVQGNGSSNSAAISGDGRYVAFVSSASNLIANDGNSKSDVFVRDLTNGSITRVSVSTAEVEGHGVAEEPAISANGRYVAFSSDSTDLVTGDVNGTSDIFVRDRTLGTTILASLKTTGAKGNGASTDPAISGDGLHVAFASLANNLVTGDDNNYRDIFVRDLGDGTTSRESLASGWTTQANDNCVTPSISTDGRYVAFASPAYSLVAGDAPAWYGGWDVFRRDRTAGTTIMVSKSTLGAQGNAGSYGSAISGDGRYVAFDSGASNLVDGDSNGYADIFLRDCTGLATSRVSISDDEIQADNGSGGAAISTNGRYVVFESLAGNLPLPGGDTNYRTDVFVRDRTGGTTVRASVSATGTQSNNRSGIPSVSSDGYYVAFDSLATNLVTGDTNGVGDIFVRDTAPLLGGTATINAGATYSKSRTVTINSGITGGATRMRFRNSTSSAYGAWMPYAASKTWTLVTGDGTKKVYAQYQRRITGPVLTKYDTIVLDTVVPAGTFKINNGATYCYSRTVTLNSAVSGGTSGMGWMRFRNSTTAAWPTTWLVYAASKSWALNSTTHGTKGVYAQYKDRAGNIVTKYDTIVLR